MNDEELIAGIEELKAVMIDVATGGRRINDVNPEFQRLYSSVASTLSRRRIENPLPYGDLWDWYGRWSSGDMPTYQSRRVFVNEIFGPLLNSIRTGRPEDFEPTGWPRVDRTVGELRERLASAHTEEQFQSVGLLCREALISLAQAVHDRERHPILDGVEVSDTDAKRRLEAFIQSEIAGRSNQQVRNHAKSALALALKLQHDRAATFRDAAMCAEATTSVINILAIASGRRDPQ